MNGLLELHSKGVPQPGHTLMDILDVVFDVVLNPVYPLMNLFDLVIDIFQSDFMSSLHWLSHRLKLL